MELPPCATDSKVAPRALPIYGNVSPYCENNSSVRGTQTFWEVVAGGNHKEIPSWELVLCQVATL